MFKLISKMFCTLVLAIGLLGCQSRPGDRIPTSPEYVSGISQGEAEARRALASGRLVLLGFGTPPDWKLKIYESEFGKYGIEWEAYGHSLDENMEGYVQGFNTLMEREIKKKYGPHLLVDLTEQVRRRLEEAPEDPQK